MAVSFNPSIMPTGITKIDSTTNTASRNYSYITLPSAINYSIAYKFGLFKNWQLGANADLSLFGYAVGVNNKFGLIQKSTKFNVSLFNRTLFSQGIILTGTTSYLPKKNAHFQSNNYLILGFLLDESEIIVSPFYNFGQIYSTKKQDYNLLEDGGIDLTNDSAEMEAIIRNRKFEFHEIGLNLGFKTKKGKILEVGFSNLFQPSDKIDYLGYKSLTTFYFGISSPIQRSNN